MKVFISSTFQDMKEYREAESYTEIELGLARTLNKPILIFLASDDVPWPITQIDRDRSQIQVLREHFLSHYLVALFSSPNDLAAKVITAMVSLMKRQHGKKTDKETKSRKVPAKHVRLIRLLLSSPGDVAEERHRVEHAVFRFNQHAVEEQGIFIKVIRWEEMAPQIGPGAQNVVNT